MNTSLRNKVLLAGVCMLAGAAAWGQQNTRIAPPTPGATDLAVTFAAERAYIAPGNCDCFWFSGGGVDASWTVWRGLGLAAALNGDHATNAAPGVDINKIAYMAGPRYTLSVAGHRGGSLRLPPFLVYGQGLAGVVDAFNSTFPSVTGLNSSAHSYAVETGGGINLSFSRGIGLRLVEADYVRSALPNDASKVQNDLRLSAGITYRLGPILHRR